MVPLAPALVLAAGANDPGLVEACGPKGDQSWACTTVYRITGDATAADVADALAKPIRIVFILLVAWIVVLRGAGDHQPLRPAPQRRCRAARDLASGRRDARHLPHDARARRAPRVDDRCGAAQRRVGADLVDRRAHHPRRARREPGAAARGRGRRRSRARLRRAVAGPRLPLRALHVRRGPVRRGRRDRRRARDRNGRGAEPAHDAPARRRGCGVARPQRRDPPRRQQVASCGRARSSTWRSATTPTSTPRST